MKRTNPAGVNPVKFKQFKEAALDLLDWSLDDISPDQDAHRLHLQMGIEREGHFIAPHLKNIEDSETISQWIANRTQSANNIAVALNFRLSQRAELNLERIYHDEGGTFVIESTTKRLSPKLAAQSTGAISRAMIEFAQNKLHIKDAHFGTMNIDFMDNMLRQFGHETFKAFTSPGEVFPLPSTDKQGVSYELAGRGQHAHVSLWCGKKNLCSEYYNFLGPLIASEGKVMLPGMILPSRNGNYLRIANESPGAIEYIDYGSNDKAGGFALNLVDKRKEHERHNNPQDYIRVEFRQGASEADPLDIALAAAIPATKACLDYVKIDEETGKAVFRDERPDFYRDNLSSTPRTPMPKSQEEAATLFNTKDNPNFVFLNRLADARITKCQQKYDEDSSAANQETLRMAKDLKGIGTKLHHMYCEQYGLKSVMPANPSSEKAEAYTR